MENIVIFLTNTEKYVEYVRRVVSLVTSHVLSHKVSKCEFAERGVSLLGCVVSKHGVQLGNSKLSVVKNTSETKTRTRAHRSMGMLAY